MQVVVSGSVDIGLSAGVLGSFGAYGKGAPIRIIGASSTGSRETFWWVAAKSLLRSMREVNGQTHRLFDHGRVFPCGGAALHQRIRPQGASVATGDAAGTITQVMSGQVDVGWAVAPFVLDLLDKGEARMIARASDIAAVRSQTIRVQITNAQNLATKKDAFARYMKAYTETVDMDVFQRRRGTALSRLLRTVGACGPAHAQGVHPEGKFADRDHLGPGREHEGRRPVQVPAGAASAAQGADPDRAGLVA